LFVLGEKIEENMELLLARDERSAVVAAAVAAAHSLETANVGSALDPNQQSGTATHRSSAL
jgi:hypothetical protein